MVDARAVRDFISSNFSLDDIKQLCHNMNIDYENLSGDTKQGKARELSMYCQRRNMLDLLAQKTIEFSQGRLNDGAPNPS